MIQQSYIGSIHLKEMKTGFQRDICTPMFITVLFTIPKIWEQPKCPSVDERTKNIRTMEYHSVMRKKDILLFVII